MHAAVTVALYADIRLPGLTCPTGSCDFDPFGSLAITSQCQNVTSSTTANCTTRNSTYGEDCIFIANDWHASMVGPPSLLWKEAAPSLSYLITSICNGVMVLPPA